jgi:hypothetical protein
VHGFYAHWGFVDRCFLLRLLFVTLRLMEVVVYVEVNCLSLDQVPCRCEVFRLFFTPTTYSYHSRRVELVGVAATSGFLSTIQKNRGLIDLHFLSPFLLGSLLLRRCLSCRDRGFLFYFSAIVVASGGFVFLMIVVSIFL